MRYISELRVGEYVREIYLCKSTATLVSSKGTSYMALKLQDKTGTIDGKVWTINAGIGSFEALDYIYVDGSVTEFQGAPQLNITRIRKADEGEYELTDYIPTSEKDIEKMFTELLNMAGTVHEPSLRTLLHRFFVEDTDFRDRFKKHSAAKMVHHGFMGGLLEHSLSVAKVCDFIAGNYPYLKRDLLITAALLHDIGKLEELSFFPENDYTDDGNLLGHIYMGAEMIGKKIDTIPDFPHVLAAELKHLILAHHGELEFGSPKKPVLAEAMALSMADNLDAKMETFKEMLSKPEADNNAWLGFQRLLDSNIRRTI